MPDYSIFLPGSETGILLIHGLGGTPTELKTIAKKFHEDGYTVSCPQLFGHCGTARELAASRHEDWLASCQRALEALSATCTAVFAGGLSMGGLISLRLAHHNKAKVKGLILFAPTLWHDGWAVPQRDFLLYLLKDTPIGKRFHFVEKWPFGLKNALRREAVLRAMRSGNSAEAGIEGTPMASLKQFWAMQKLVMREVKAIAAPTLILHAREDDVASLKNVEFLQRNLAGLVESVILNDSYHLVTLDNQRDIAYAYVRHFLHMVKEHGDKMQGAQE